MSEESKAQPGAGPSHRSVEIGVSIATGLFALIVIGGSLQAGIGWGAEGPRAGFFPFYVALAILAASVVNFIQALAEQNRDREFAEWGQLGQVASVLVPAAIYVALVPLTGIYVASVPLIGVFMRWLGRYGWPLVLILAIGVPIVTFVVFEKWFLVPLPKGPIEEWLGF